MTSCVHCKKSSLKPCPKFSEVDRREISVLVCVLVCVLPLALQMAESWLLSEAAMIETCLYFVVDIVHERCKLVFGRVLRYYMGGMWSRCAVTSLSGG